MLGKKFMCFRFLLVSWFALDLNIWSHHLNYKGQIESWFQYLKSFIILLLVKAACALLSLFHISFSLTFSKHRWLSQMPLSRSCFISYVSLSLIFFFFFGGGAGRAPSEISWTYTGRHGTAAVLQVNGQLCLNMSLFNMSVLFFF